MTTTDYAAPTLGARIYRKSSDDLPLTDGTYVAELGSARGATWRFRYRKNKAEPMVRVAAVDGPFAGQHFALYEDEIES